MSDETASIIDDFKRLLGEDTRVTLTNMYKEVPIVHRAFICDVRGDRLVLETNELQICAIHWSGSTVIQAPALGAPVEAQLDSTDIRRNLVTLSRFRTTELPSQGRATIRVRLKKPLRISLCFDGAVISGVIHDLSLGGCRVRTGHHSPEITEMRVEIELDGHSVQIPGRVLRVEGESPAFQCAVVFQHSQETEQTVSVFIHKRELEIIKELQGSL